MKTQSSTKPISYVPDCGMHISDACKEAVALAAKRNRDVVFDFNELTIIAHPTDSAEKVAARYHTESERRHAAYIASSEGIANAKRDSDDIAEKQATLDILVPGLVNVCATGNMDTLMKWLKLFTNAADRIGVTYPRQTVYDTLQAAGYSENDLVDKDPAFYSTRERMGRYIVGQAMNCLERGMGPHPVTLSFIERYMAIRPTK